MNIFKVLCWCSVSLLFQEVRRNRFICSGFNYGVLPRGSADLGNTDEPVPHLLPVHGLLAGGGLVGEHGQAGGQVRAHLNT
jgi:hypothetical protein